MAGIAWVWLGGLACSFACVAVGVSLRFFGHYGLLAGYNTAPPEEKARYDVEGLGNHVGNGLITMGVLLGMTTATLGLGYPGWSGLFVALFIGVAFLIVVGGRKFLPGRADPSEHGFLRWLLPERAFRAVEVGTRHWLIECPCGHAQDFWDAGGVRYKATGEPRQLFRCAACKETRWNKVRRKRDSELGGPGRSPGG